MERNSCESRLIRAIEIASHRPDGGRAGGVGVLEHFRILKIGLSIPKTKLFQRIDQRVDVRMKQGMLNEVRRLHRQGVSWKKLDGFGLEYRFLSRYLRGLLTKDEAVAQLKSASHHFAKRQMTWWKRDADIHWVTNQTQALSLVNRMLCVATSLRHRVLPGQ